MASSKRSSKVIITCAVTGAVHTPSMSEYLPLTPDQIVQNAVDAANAGAAIVHLHARDPHDGRPTPDPAVFDMIVPRIREQTDAVINITTGGSTRMTLEERLAYPLQLQPEMCSLNMGSMNFSIHPVAQKITQWRYPWEQSYIAGMEDLIHVEGFRQKYNDDLTWLQAYSAVALLANAIKESGSTEPKDVALAMEDMELESINGTVKMRASDHQLQQPLSVATWSKINDTNVQIEQEGTGFGWRTDEVIPAADSERPTTCKMKRPT